MRLLIGVGMMFAVCQATSPAQEKVQDPAWKFEERVQKLEKRVDLLEKAVYPQKFSLAVPGWKTTGSVVPMAPIPAPARVQVRYSESFSSGGIARRTPVRNVVFTPFRAIAERRAAGMGLFQRIGFRGCP